MRIREVFDKARAFFAEILPQLAKHDQKRELPGTVEVTAAVLLAAPEMPERIAISENSIRVGNSEIALQFPFDRLQIEVDPNGLVRIEPKKRAANK